MLNLNIQNKQYTLLELPKDTRGVNLSSKYLKYKYFDNSKLEIVTCKDCRVTSKDYTYIGLLDMMKNSLFEHYRTNNNRILILENKNNYAK